MGGEPCASCGTAGCSGGDCVANPCGADVYEPNDSRYSASYLGSYDDSDNTTYYVSGSDIYPSTDEDWYSAYANNTFLGDLQVDVNLGSLSVDLDLCVTFACDEGSPTVQCNSTTDTPSGSDTCCSSQAGTASERVVMEPDGCGGAAGGYAYIRVYGFGSATQCDYYLTYKL